MVRVSLFVLLSLMVLVMRRIASSRSSLRLLDEGGARLGTQSPGEPESWKKRLLSWFHL